MKLENKELSEHHKNLDGIEDYEYHEMLSNLPPPLGSKTKNRRLLRLNPRSLNMSKLLYC